MHRVAYRHKQHNAQPHQHFWRCIVYRERNNNGDLCICGAAAAGWCNYLLSKICNKYTQGKEEKSNEHVSNTHITQCNNIYMIEQ